MRDIASLAELKALVGLEVGVSRWFEMSQQRIGTFADATDDHQWIHLDHDRAARESPFGGTVAHGFLTLSLLPAMLEDAIVMRDVKMGLNYGLNKVRFPAPVPAGSRVRARITLGAVDEFAGGAQLIWDVVVEREGSDKPVCVAEFLVRRYP
ncbi:MAG: MaoC family dehydratase [Massilia sp.]